MPNYAIVNDEVVANGNGIPNSTKGLIHIVGKSTPNDRKWVMKVDPSLVKEKINGKEAENLGRMPILVYDFYDMAKRGRQFDVWVVNGVCFLLGAGLMVSLYFWKVIEVFTK
jgi:hypothetical protein